MIVNWVLLATLTSWAIDFARVCPVRVAERAAWQEKALNIWLKHEVHVNSLLGQWAPEGFHPLRAAIRNLGDGKFQWVSRVDPEFRALEHLFREGDHWVVPIHPKHSPLDPHPKRDWQVAHQTASSSVVVAADQQDLAVPVFGLKLPRAITPQDEKGDLSLTIRSTLAWSEHYAEVDARLGPPPENLVMLKDLGAWVDAKTGNGIILRDLRPMLNVPSRHAWIPGFSIPVRFPNLALAAETQIAATNARLLLRYGFWPENPHSQQYLFLVNMKDGTLKGATGVRDLGDGRLIEPVARALGMSIDSRAVPTIQSAKYDFRGKTPEPIFLTELFKELQYPPPDGVLPQDFSAFLSSPLGQAAIRRYHGLPQDLLPPLPNRVPRQPAELQPKPPQVQ